jgi:hypothetical protein
LPADRRSSAATVSATSTRRTAIVTAAPAPAKARTVSAPIPAAPPVTIAFRLARPTPATTSAAVDWNPKWVVNRVIVPTTSAKVYSDVRQQRLWSNSGMIPFKSHLQHGGMEIQVKVVRI